MGRGMTLKGNVFHIRRRVPSALKASIGKGEIWRSLDTGDVKTAIGRSHYINAEIEALFEQARLIAGMTVDPTILEPSPNGLATNYLNSIASQALGNLQAQLNQHAGQNSIDLSFAEAYDRYLSDPTHDWSRRTRVAHAAARTLATSVIGADIPIGEITRAHCRDFVDVLKRIPKNAGKRFPKLTPREAADNKGPTCSPKDRMSVANINAYITKLGSFFNWAALEELIDKSPSRGMLIAEKTRKRDKRKPFSPSQLQTVFDAPLYRGCVDDKFGCNKKGSQLPKGTRFWIPLIGLFTGMRLNEICQLELMDVRFIENIPCFIVTEKSRLIDSQKRLKTEASDRLIPVHQRILDIGFAQFISRRKCSGETMLFNDINIDANGFRSTAFSKWFIRFGKSAGAIEERTSFHSFRHNFRDALREAEVSRDIAHALGGWTNGDISTETADDYGRGYGIPTLNNAIQKINYPMLDLSHLIGTRARCFV